MPPKGDRKLTYREKSSISFIEQDEPDFIKKMKQKAGFREAATVEDKFVDEEEEVECDSVESELLHTKDELRPQVVVLNEETDLTNEDLKKALEEQAKKEDEKKIAEGKITFKKPIKRGADGKEDEEALKEEKRKRIEKSRQPQQKVQTSLLSFGDEEEEE